MSEVFTNEDVVLLDKSMRLRERLVDNIAKLPDDQLPHKASDLMAVVNLAESIDRTIIQKAKLTIDKEGNDDNKTTSAVLRQLMMDLHTNKPSGPLQGVTNSQPPEYKSNSDLKIKEGEMIARTDTISLED